LAEFAPLTPPFLFLLYCVFGFNPLFGFIFCWVAFQFLLLWVVLHSRGEDVSNGVTLTAVCLSISGVELDW